MSFNEKREWEDLQKDIKQLEEETGKLTTLMADPSLAYDELMKSSARIAAINEQLDQKEMRWLELSEIEEQ